MKDEIFAGLEEVLAYAKQENTGIRTHKIEVPEKIDVVQIRRNLGMSQNEFCNTFGFAISTLRHWERQRRRPEGPARILLKVIEKDPTAVLSALTSEDHPSDAP